MSEQIICRNAVLGYEDGIVVENLNFKVCEGNYLCILGENGSGKSTLVKTLLGLKSVISGEIKWCGGISSKDIGYLPQQTVVQRDFPASVNEIVMSGCLSKCGLRPFYNKEERKTVQKNLDLLGISNIASKSYRDLSGGQQQRVLLARALCAAKKLLLLDEPVTGLDPKAALDMYEIIKKLNNDNITIIMISHDMESSLKYATHILHIADKIFFGTKKEYLSSRQGRSFLMHTEKGGDENV